jgi:V/A-type H+/Na+-transporting ATPase subunit F
LRFLCIGDEDTARGFRLAGITASAVKTPKEALAAIEDASQQTDCGVIIITEKAAAWVRKVVETIRLERDRPLIVEIPGPEGPLPGRKSLKELVAEAVGVSME